LLGCAGSTRELVPGDRADLDFGVRLSKLGETPPFGAPGRKSIREEVYVQLDSHLESLVFRLEPAYLLPGVVAFEKWEKSFEDFGSLPTTLGRHSEHRVPVMKDGAADGLRGGAPVA